MPEHPAARTDKSPATRAETRKMSVATPPHTLTFRTKSSHSLVDADNRLHSDGSEANTTEQTFMYHAENGRLEPIVLKNSA